MLLWAIGTLICGGLLVYYAARNEINGTAIYHKYTGGRGATSEAVTRETSPAKFRHATNLLWVVALFSLGVAAIGFTFYRKLDDCA